MGKRSLKSSEAGISLAKQAFDTKGWTQEYLAAEVELSSRQSIWKFFTGRPIERQIFQKICQKLELDWIEIADLPPELQSITQIPNIEDDLGIQGWVQALRIQLSEPLTTQCNSLQSSFELNQPRLSQIYTDLNILPQPSHQRWLEVSDFQESSDKTRFSLMQQEQLGIDGLEIVQQHDKLVILGKPGAGKTTFLQYLALQCIEEKYEKQLIPLFIQLRNLDLEETDTATFNLETYIIETLQHFSASPKQASTLIQVGKLLLLLDGLDEIPETKNELLVKEIDRFSQAFYKNKIIITCRSAVKSYYFKGFTYVEIADFTADQIQLFAEKWFRSTSINEAEGKQKAKTFQEKLNAPENQAIRELGITPILLNLICSVFKERSDFPKKRAKLYQTALDILLQRWDLARGIQRDQVYRYLSLPEKIKLLCKIAAVTFESESYVFEIDQVLYLIEDYLRNLPETNIQDLETLWLNCEAILKAIELQHGLLVERAKDIYSFSHITFQEYLTARKIVATDLDQLDEELKKLSYHVTDKRWREVILLTISMLPSADNLVNYLNQAIKQIAITDEQLHNYLKQIDQKVRKLNLSCHPASVRAFYFTLLQNQNLDLTTSFSPRLSTIKGDLDLTMSLSETWANMENVSPELKLDKELARAFTDSLSLCKNPDIQKFLNLCFALELDTKFALTPATKQGLETLKQQIPNTALTATGLKAWWTQQGEKWIDEFRQFLFQERQIGCPNLLTSQQVERWQQYYTANIFLMECLQSDGQISNHLKAEIKDTLLLP